MTIESPFTLAEVTLPTDIISPQTEPVSTRIKSTFGEINSLCLQGGSRNEISEKIAKELERIHFFEEERGEQQKAWITLFNNLGKKQRAVFINSFLGSQINTHLEEMMRDFLVLDNSNQIAWKMEQAVFSTTMPSATALNSWAKYCQNPSISKDNPVVQKTGKRLIELVLKDPSLLTLGSTNIVGLIAKTGQSAALLESPKSFLTQVSIVMYKWIPTAIATFLNLKPPHPSVLITAHHVVSIFTENPASFNAQSADYLDVTDWGKLYKAGVFEDKNFCKEVAKYKESCSLKIKQSLEQFLKLAEEKSKQVVPPTPLPSRSSRKTKTDSPVSSIRSGGPGASVSSIKEDLLLSPVSSIQNGEIDDDVSSICDGENNDEVSSIYDANDELSSIHDGEVSDNEECDSSVSSLKNQQSSSNDLSSIKDSNDVMFKKKEKKPNQNVEVAAQNTCHK